MDLKKNSFIRIFCFITLISVIIFSSIVSQAAKPYVSANTAVVMDVETGLVLYEKNMHSQRPPASLTKVLTSIIAIEEGKLNDVVTVSRKAAYTGGSSIYLGVNEKLTLEELIYGVMLESGNDAAVAVAEHIAGSVDEFAKLMNQKAREFGALHSNFCNPHGLPQQGHITTAYDLAIIMSYALHNPKFTEITGTKIKNISWAKYPAGRRLVNHNELLWSYPDTTGGKTGYTRAAGRCLLSSARKNGREVVAVVLNSNNDWQEVSQLLTYGLTEFKRIPIIKRQERVFETDWEESREKVLKIVAADEIATVIPSGGKVKHKKIIKLKPELTLPINQGERVGELEIYCQDKLIGRTALLAENDLTYASIFMRLFDWLKKEMEALKAQGDSS